MVRAPLAGLCLLTLAVLTPACDGGSESRSSEPTTSTTSVEDAVLAAYRDYWDAFDAAKDPPNPDHRELTRHTAGRELKRLRRLFAEDIRVGVVRRGEVALSPRVDEVSARAALVVDCYIDSGGIYVRDTGEVVTSPEPEAVQARYELRQLGGAWKVVRRTEETPSCEG